MPDANSILPLLVQRRQDLKKEMPRKKTVERSTLTSWDKKQYSSTSQFCLNPAQLCVEK